jgi:hypothetical protein
MAYDAIVAGQHRLKKKEQQWEFAIDTFSFDSG